MGINLASIAPTRLAVLTVVGFLVVVLWFSTENSSTPDFVQYYSATQIFWAGGNPYDPQTMLDYQRTLPGLAKERQAMMFWSLPATLIFLPPYWMPGSLSESSYAWRIVSFCFLIAAVVLMLIARRKYFADVTGTIKLLAAGICAAVPMSLDLGQSTALFVLCVAATIVLVERRRLFLAGLSLSVLLLKPHLVVFLLAILFSSSCYSTELRRFVCGIILGFCFLIVAGESCFPGSTRLWFDSVTMTKESSAAVFPRNWACATVGSLVGRQLPQGWPQVSIILPMLSCAVAVWIIITKRLAISLPRDISWLLPASLLLAPFGWLYDHSILLPVQFLIVPILWERARIWVYGLLLWNLLTLEIYLGGLLNFHSQFWWYPLASLALGLIAAGRLFHRGWSGDELVPSGA